MGHNSSKEWINNLSVQQKKFLLKQHGGWSQFNVDKFDNNTKDKLMKMYQNDIEFNNLSLNTNTNSPTDWTTNFNKQ